jgi:hypothetical protein
MLIHSCPAILKRILSNVPSIERAMFGKIRTPTDICSINLREQIDPNLIPADFSTRIGWSAEDPLLILAFHQSQIISTTG